MISEGMLEPLLKMAKIKLYDLPEDKEVHITADIALDLDGILVLPKTETKPRTTITFNGQIAGGSGVIKIKKTTS